MGQDDELRFTEHDALKVAVEVGAKSPCAKSKRGVVIFDDIGRLGVGYNRPPTPIVCGRNEACREACSKICIHAEADAITHLNLLAPVRWSEKRAITGNLQLLHTEVRDGIAIPGGPPSCWQCSREILEARIAYVWLNHDDGLRRYTAMDFYRFTASFHRLPVFDENYVKWLGVALKEKA